MALVEALQFHCSQEVSTTNNKLVAYNKVPDDHFLTHNINYWIYTVILFSYVSKFMFNMSLGCWEVAYKLLPVICVAHRWTLDVYAKFKYSWTVSCQRWERTTKFKKLTKKTEYPLKHKQNNLLLLWHLIPVQTNVLICKMTIAICKLLISGVKTC